MDISVFPTLLWSKCGADVLNEFMPTRYTASTASHHSLLNSQQHNHRSRFESARLRLLAAVQVRAVRVSNAFVRTESRRRRDPRCGHPNRLVSAALLPLRGGVYC